MLAIHAFRLYGELRQDLNIKYTVCSFATKLLKAIEGLNFFLKQPV